VKLGDHEIHVWLAFDGDFTGTPWLREHSDDIEPHEHAVAARRLENLRPQYLLTRALQRTVLSQYAPGVTPAQWRFTANDGAKPELATEFSALGLHFNLSHTARLVVMAVGRQPMGIDTEYLAAPRAPLDIADRFFTTTELADLVALPPADHARRFYTLWTLKEAWIKATGEGIAADLYGLSFEFDDPTRARAFQMSKDDAGQWAFWQGGPGAEHTLALALRGRAEVKVFRCRPGRALEWEPQPPLYPVASDQEQGAQA
jgi:4'-phosphopantetheinyl transferase